MSDRIFWDGYIPRPLQWKLHNELRRFNVIVCHRRFGKTVFRLNDQKDRLLRNGYKNPQGFYIAPTYGQAKRVAWDYTKEFTRSHPGVTVNEAEMRVDMLRPQLRDRVRMQLLGAENPASIRGVYADDVTFDEYAEMDPTVWTQVVRPALSDRGGGATFIGTPKGMNHFHQIYEYASQRMADGDPEWYCAIFKASETGIIPESELAAARALMSEEEYEQEYLCSFQAALIGAYYGKEMSWLEDNKRIISVPFDAQGTVLTGWDLGVNDTTVIWFAQRIHKEVHLIDYVEDSGRGLDFYVDILLQKKAQWGCVYDTHIMPHDIAVRELGVGDVARSRLDTLRNLGIRNVKVIPRTKLEEQINAVRIFLKRCFFDMNRCSRGINSLRNYQKKWDAKNGIYSSQPLHNWASHGASAFATLALGFREEDTQVLRDLPRDGDRDYDVFGRNQSDVVYANKRAYWR